jgi:hypothetical protein
MLLVVTGGRKFSERPGLPRGEGSVDRRYLLGAWSEPRTNGSPRPSQGAAWRFVDGIGSWIRDPKHLACLELWEAQTSVCAGLSRTREADGDRSTRADCDRAVADARSPVPTVATLSTASASSRPSWVDSIAGRSAGSKWPRSRSLAELVPMNYGDSARLLVSPAPGELGDYAGALLRRRCARRTCPGWAPDDERFLRGRHRRFRGNAGLATVTQQGPAVSDAAE